MIKATSLFAAMMGSVVAIGCGADVPTDVDAENEEIVENLKLAGYPDSEIQIVDGRVVVGNDAYVSLAASREMIEDVGSGEEQYRTTNLMSRSLVKVCINASSAFTGNFSTGLNNAIANYNALPLTFDFARGPTTGCNANISAVIQPGLVGGSAGFPSGGLPYNQVIVGGGLSAYSVDVIEHVITHELGHAIGFRHSDYYNRAISCGSGGNEGSAGVGAILISGTPSTATVGGSIMNACFRSTETGEFTSTDVTALNVLY